MNVLRNLYLQRTLSLLILSVALFAQIQTLYACDSMAAKPKQVCCCGEQDAAICPMIDSCAMHEQLAQTSCCELSYETLNDVGMINSATTVDILTLLLDGPQPPPLIAVLQFSPIALPTLSRLYLVSGQSELSRLDQQTYRLTQRLRL